MTLFSTLVCWHYAAMPPARATLRWISRVYCGVMLWQGLLLSGVMMRLYMASY